MKKHFPINEQKYIDLLRYADMDDRIDHAFSYIDEVIECFIDYGEKADGHALIAIIKYGYDGWKKLVRYDIPMGEDEDGLVFILSKDDYADRLLQRFFETSVDEESYGHMIGTLVKIFDKHKMSYKKPMTWDEWIFSPDTPAPPGEAVVSASKKQTKVNLFPGTKQ